MQKQTSFNVCCSACCVCSFMNYGEIFMIPSLPLLVSLLPLPPLTVSYSNLYSNCCCWLCHRETEDAKTFSYKFTVKLLLLSIAPFFSLIFITVTQFHFKLCILTFPLRYVALRCRCKKIILCENLSKWHPKF